LVEDVRRFFRDRDSFYSRLGQDSIGIYTRF
jgi:hypothetical protein